jgi:hypothetical protein
MTTLSFEDWRQTPLGADIYDRIMHNRHNGFVNSAAAYFNTLQDVQQKALIWVWQT